MPDGRVGTRFEPHPPETRARAVDLAAAGTAHTHIASELGVNVKTVDRWVAAAARTTAAAGMRGGGSPTVDGETAGDAIVRNIAEGRKHRAKRTDPKPRTTAAGPPPAAAHKVTDAELVQSLETVLCLPAVPMALYVGCDYCANHFARTGAPAARELVRLSQTSPGLRRALETIHRVRQSLITGGILAMYAGKPLLHHLAPNDVLAFAGPVIGVPPRKSMAGDSRVTAEPVHSNGNGTAPPDDQAPLGTDPPAAAAA
jgi:transposase-like protein